MNTPRELSGTRSEGSSTLGTVELCLFGLSRKILFLAAKMAMCSEKQSPPGSPPLIKILSTLAGLCADEIVAISHLPNSPLRPITTELLAQYSALATYPDPEGVAATGPHLSRRESEIVGLLSRGLANKEVASALDISVRTVEAYRARIMHKLHLRNVSHLVLYGVRNGIVHP